MRLPKRWSNKFNVVGECWVWKGTSYPAVRPLERRAAPRSPARLFYEYLFRVKLSPAVYLIPWCGTPRCVNPAHRHPGTREEVALANLSKRNKARWEATECPQGHVYTEETSYWRTHAGNGRREHVCRICKRAARRRLLAKNGTPVKDHQRRRCAGSEGLSMLFRDRLVRAKAHVARVAEKATRRFLEGVDFSALVG